MAQAAKTGIAIEKATAFAKPRRESIAPLDRPARAPGILTGELVAFDPALLEEQLPEGAIVEREGIADLADVEGFHPNLAIKTALKDVVDEPIVVTDVQFVPTPPQFLAEKRAKGQAANEMTAVLFFLRQDGRYYVAVSGNNRVMREAATIGNMLRRVQGVRATVESYTSTGGVGYRLGSGPR
jgi:hypothetical protein